MALYLGARIVNDFEIRILLEGKRYRAMIYDYKSSNSTCRMSLRRRMHDKDIENLYSRAREWCLVNESNNPSLHNAN